MLDALNLREVWTAMSWRSCLAMQCFGRSSIRWPVLTVFALLVAISTRAPLAQAVTPESPEVRELIERGLASLEGHEEIRLGGKCLIALAFIKDGASPDNPHVVAAVSACQKADPKITDVYSNGLAIIFLSELNPTKHRSLIERYAGMMNNRQKKFGAWGYNGYSTGDTSQTQYAALSFWELLQIGMAPDVKKVDACANWLLRTQDPSGTWGYQGRDPGTFELVEQNKTGLSMLAAGLGSTMIFGNILGLTNPGAGAELAATGGPATGKAPTALKLAEVKDDKRTRVISGSQVDRSRLMNAISQGQAWFDKHFHPDEIASEAHSCYVLYSMERYKSFEELLNGGAVEEPEWYQHGYAYLKSNELEGGGWRSKSGQPCATAFGVLFLLRSTQKSIKANLGEGTLVGGRGLSANLNRMKMRGGRLVREEKPTEVDQFLGMLDGDGNEALEALVNDPTALQVNNVGPEQARRLQQLVKSGDPEARILAVRALSKLRDLDQAPTLIFAMTDPDKRVAREARDGLRYVSRQFGGFGLPDNFSDSERYSAIDKWKKWYQRVRPNAPPLP